MSLPSPFVQLRAGALLAGSLLITACARSASSEMDELPAAASAGGATSLPTVSSGTRPGPELLYLNAPEAPQLENVAPWSAAPILISGATAYRDGEFLYQDFLHDDRGAAGLPDPTDPMPFGGPYNFSPKAGTLTYSTDPVFANSAADLVELRIKPLSDSTAIRVTLNTLVDPARVAFTIAIGTSAEPVAWPHGAGVSSPAQLFVTVHGDSAELHTPENTQPIGLPALTVTVDLYRRQFDVRVPHAVWNPGTGSARFAAGVGLWNPSTQRYLAPSALASATVPGGMAVSRAALFNLAFRTHEALPDWRVIGVARTTVDALAAVTVESKWWREFDQAAAPRSGDISAFYADVDFAKLEAKVDDDSGVPRSGPMDRIFASRFSFGQGVDYDKTCGRFPESCEGIFVGQLQSYALYVPPGSPPATGWGLTLQLHALGSNHNIFMGSNYQLQFGNRGSGSLGLTPASRGPDGDYTDIPEADTFEAWADVARHYPLDPDWTSISGYSMGGTATYKLAGRWPDLFARAMAVTATPDADKKGGHLPPLHNIPLLVWVGTADEGSGPKFATVSQKMAAAGLRFSFDSFLTADHLTLITNNEWMPAADFLGEHSVDRDPPRITYIVDPGFNSPRAQMVADHAYWLSDLKLRDSGPDQTGQIDVRSEAFGVEDAAVLGLAIGPGTLSGGMHGPMPYLRLSQDWSPELQQPTKDRLVIEATNIASLTVDVQRARLSCEPELQVTSDGPLTISIAGCDRVVTVN